MDSHEFITAVIEGQADGGQFILSINECTNPDALANKLIEIIAADGPGNPTLRGFARPLQKRLERK